MRFDNFAVLRVDPSLKSGSEKTRARPRQLDDATLYKARQIDCNGTTAALPRHNHAALPGRLIAGVRSQTNLATPCTFDK